MTGTRQLPRLQLLGGFRLMGATSEELRLSSRKGKALLAVVALASGQSATRARLRALLWSDRGEEQASASLRQLLMALRKELAPLGRDILRIQDDTVGLDRGTLEIDTYNVVSAFSAGDAAQFVAWYGGLLLDGFDLGDQAFEEWLGTERRSFLSLAVEMFDRRSTELAGEARVAMAQRLLALDPLREASHCAIIAAHLANGNTALARKQFETCKALLARELGVAPAAATEALLVNPDAIAPTTKPVIVVLPFTNLSDDPAQRYFSDGITADIITELLRFRQFLVRAAKGKPDADELSVGREFGAHYIAAGSVRRLGKRIRITLQLIDADTGETPWSEHFDADEEDIFIMQDQIVRSIAAQLSVRLRLASSEKASRKPPNSMAAYDYVLRGDALPIGIPEAEAEAISLFRKAIALDPDYGRAYAHISISTTLGWVRDLDAPAAILDEALDLAKRAVELDEGDELCHSSLAYVHLQRKEHELTEYHYLKALALNPNHHGLLLRLGIFYGFNGDPQRGLGYFREATVINPHFNPSWYWRNRAHIHFIAREYEDAITAFKRSPILPDWAEAYLAAAFAYLGQMDEARQHTDATRRLTPGFSITKFMCKEPYRRREDAEHAMEGLRKAGLPE